MTLSQVQRTVTHTNTNGEKIFSLTDLGTGMVNMAWYDISGNIAFTIPKIRRESLLDAFMALWPENVAYQFESKEDE